ncbi:PDZ and LIM domain protein Zasp isoform X2 [Sitodiplosis mosellana]|uniref:PDZ and LIM domain protein Zasp isoform X2 n=1 Tax=Sitodiplosis mosellana TaxID=263140 RepID=UPI002443E22F|nr:PDZ and LIM domain protein Zasp isoform X2 [Sitodiplosis mosellana]
MAQLINIRLNRVDAQPWGLRLQGGKDFGTPLVVQKVSQGSISDQAGLQPGDAVIAVNNVEAFNLRHKDAQDLIVRSGNTFELTIQRGGSTWKPHVTPTGSLPSPGQQHHYGVGPVTKTSLQHHPPPNEQHIGCGYNNSARPFNQNGSVGGGSGNVKSIVNKQYNTPVGMYSEESIAETLTAQAEVLANGVLGVNFKKNEKAYNSEGSEVLKALKESENDPREPVSSHFYWTASHAIGNYSAISSRTNTPNPYSGQQQQQQVQQQLSQQISRNEDFAASESVQRSILPSTTTDSTKTPIVQTKIVDSSSQCIAASADASPPCGDCGATIVGVFVRIKDKNLHVDCFKCATCGTSLKNQGYFNINNKLYCDVHAKLAAVQSAPTGTEGYRPGLIQPNSKLTANSTISNALSSHVNGGVKSNFGGPRPFGVPTAGPRSPAMHQQSWSQPKPAPTFANNYGSHTLPRSTVGQNAPEETTLQQQSETGYDLDFADELPCPSTSLFSWPPPPEDDQRYTPTASPLYIPPPGTQRVQPKFIAQTSVEQRFCATAGKTEVETTKVQDVIDMVPASWLTQESRSAPQLTSMNLREHNELTESCSDSYTSTCTTTTTTSEEYQRMYNAQVALLQSQSQSFYDHSSLDLNSSNCDYEVVSIQQQRGSFSSGSTDLMGFSGRRSAQECSDTICSTINTSQLVNYIKGNTFDGGDYSISAPPKLPKKVGFSPNITEVETDTLINSGSQPSSIAEEQNLSEMNVQESQDTHESQELQELHELQLSQAAQEPNSQLKLPFDRKSVTPSPNIIYNATPKEWKSLMVQALTTASDKPYTISDLPETVTDNSTYESYVQTSTTTTSAIDRQTLEVEQKVEEVQSVLLEKTEDEQVKVEIEEPSKKGFLSSLFTGSDSSASMDWFKPIYENVPLPEESAPYFPPDIPLLPIERHEPLRTKSPFVEALTVAPLRPFTPFENDVISQIEGLPRAPDVTLVDALTTAPTKPITKFNPDLPDETDTERIVRLEKEKQEKESAEVRALISKTLDAELSKKCTTFAPLKGFRKVDPFKPLSSYNQSPHCQSRSSSVCTENVDKTKKTTIDSVDQTQTNTKNKACHIQTKESNRNMKFVKTNNFPPPPGTPVKSYVQSGLQSPKTIPKYQRQWFNLASQSPIRTPEPPELKENVPLAFCDVPHEKTESVSKPIAITISASTASSSSATATESARTESTVVVDVQKTTAVESSFSSESASTVATVVPTLSENRTAPITMTFQTLDPKDIVEPMRSTTPSLINKPPPLVPYYQQNLVCEYYGAPNSFTFDPTNPRSPSPRPDAMKPYASGPPANVLKIQAPRITTPDSLELSTSIGVPSIVTGQSGAQLLAASRQGYSTASQSFVAQPEVFHREQKGGLSIETHSTGAELNEAKKSDMQSSSMYQVGNVQVQQNRRVVEEFEHTQKSSTTEIHTSSCSGGVSELQQKIAIGAIANEYQSETYGKGFVARQARRLSETSQSSSKNVVSSYRFPQITPDITESGFPIGNKIVEPPTPTPTPILNEPVAKVAKPIAQKTSFPPPSLPKTSFAPPRLSPIPQRSALSPRVSPVPQKISFPPPIDVAAYDDQYSSSNLNANASSLTSQYQSSAYQSLTTAGPSAFLSNPNYGSTSKPTISISIPGFKPSNFNNNQNTVSVSDPTPASAGSSNKNFSQNIGAATSTPKRGRGVLNASVAPGGRIPKCGCCQAQIRGPFITALGRIWCPDHFVCVNGTCRRPLQDIGFVEEKGDLYCEYCFEQFLAPPCDKCNGKIKGDCLNAIGKHFHPECFNCTYCGKLFGNSPFFLEDGRPYCEADWNELFTTKCFACGFPVEAGDRWVEALSHNYHSQCFNCTMCKKNLEGQSFYAKAGRPYCKNHAR